VRTAAQVTEKALGNPAQMMMTSLYNTVERE